MAILITGSEGLIGSALSEVLTERGERVVKMDLSLNRQGNDILDPVSVEKKIVNCRGIVHLAAVSRVIWGENDPRLCKLTNVQGTRNIIEAALSSARKPWFIFASSREVYGTVDILPATEETPLNPVNIYGHAKAAAEGIINEARNLGLKTTTVRFSNVYGSTEDHHDRVIPAFARAAVKGLDLRIDGSGNIFDFTYLDDTVRGLVSLIDLMDLESQPPPPIHLLTGQPCTLGEAARIMVSLAGSKSKMVEAPSRSFDVSQFYGDPSRAFSILGWKPKVTFKQGFERIICDYKTKFTSNELLREAS